MFYKIFKFFIIYHILPYVSYFTNFVINVANKCDEGTTDAVDEANVTLSPETCLVESYKVLNCNANVLNEIFQKHPDTAINFGLKHPDYQSSFMNSLAELYQNILKSNQKMLEFEEIDNMDVMIQDMEHNGLQLTWLKEMLAEVRKRLEDQEEERNLQRKLEYLEAEMKKVEHQLERKRIHKKPRFS